MASDRKKIGEILVERGVIDRHQLKAALDRQNIWAKRLGETLVDMNFINEEALMKILSEHFRVPAIDVDKFPVETQAVELVKGEFCMEHSLMPIAIRKIQGQTRIVVATADPSDIAPLDELRFKVNMPVAVAVTSLSSVQAAIRKHYFAGSIDRDEITITTTVRPEDAVMEIIRAGRQDKVFLTEEDNVGVHTRAPAPGAAVGSSLAKLVDMMVKKSILTRDEAEQILSDVP